MSTKRGRIAEFDGLRAAAILLVLCRHGVRPFWSPEGLFPVWGWDAAIPLLNGWMGVDLFFVLSGFLITRHILDLQTATGGFRIGDYLKRRALRIVPAYLAALLLALSGLVPFYAISSDALGLRIVYHLLFLQDYLPANIVVAFWSLGVEEKFYLLAPAVLFAAAALSRTARWILLGGLAGFPVMARLATYAASPEIGDYDLYFRTFRSPFHLTFDGMAVGMICAFILRDRAGRSAPRHGSMLFWMAAAPTAGLLLTTPLIEAPGRFVETLLPLLLALGMGAMLLGLALGGGPGRLLRNKVLGRIGQLSYSLYLVHMMTIPLGLVLVDLAASNDGGRAGRFLLFVPIYAALSLGSACLLHHLVERPFLQWRDSGRVSIANRAGIAHPGGSLNSK